MGKREVTGEGGREFCPCDTCTIRHTPAFIRNNQSQRPPAFIRKDPCRMAHRSMHSSALAHPQSQKSCRKTQRFASGRMRRARQRTTTISPTQHCIPGTAARVSTRPSETVTGPAQTQTNGPAPLQLQVILEPGSGELSLPT